MIYNSIFDLIGNTPILQIPESVHGLKNFNVYAKLELFNPWGSVKDRTAFAMIKDNLDDLGEFDLFESSSGNTAKALQIIGSMKGTKLKTITNRIKVPEQRDILTLLGTEIQELPGTSDCYDPNDPNDPLVLIHREISKSQNKSLFTDQYNNSKNYQTHFDTTGYEIDKDLAKVDYLITGLGTNGSVRGIADRLRLSNPELTTIGVVASKQDFIPGIRNADEIMEVGLFKPEYFKEIINISSMDAVDWSLKLIRQVGLLAGPTTGASLAGVVNYLQQFDTQETDEKKNVVFIACDRAEWYISYYKQRRPEIFTGVEKQSWSDNISISSDIELNADELDNFASNSQSLLIDTRSAFSFKVAHVPNAINMPFEYLDKMLNENNPFCKNRPILFLCPLGEKSALIASYLRTLGSEAYSLKGGINGLRDLDYHLERDL